MFVIKSETLTFSGPGKWPIRVAVLLSIHSADRNRIDVGVALFHKSTVCTLKESHLLDETMDDSDRRLKNLAAQAWHQL
jgi:hypothetical protein